MASGADLPVLSVGVCRRVALWQSNGRQFGRQVTGRRVRFVVPAGGSVAGHEEAVAVPLVWERRRWRERLLGVVAVVTSGARIASRRGHCVTNR